MGDLAIMANPSLSPDAQRVAVDVADPKDRNVDVWIHNLPGHAYTRFTFDPAEETNAVWSHDGKTIAYRSAAITGPVVRFKNANGLEAEQSAGRGMPTSWTHDDTGLVITLRTPEGGSKVLLLSLADGKETPVVTGSGNQYGGASFPGR